MLEQPWPDDLPACCPVCGGKFKTSLNFVIGPGRISRALKAIAWGMMVPWMIVATVLALGMLGPGRSGGYAIVGMIFIPPALLAIASGLFPLSRRVTCNVCGWRMEYSMKPKAMLRHMDNSPR
jgi:hypothetical protein